jgi:hypothetical protein
MAPTIEGKKAQNLIKLSLWPFPNLKLKVKVCMHADVQAKNYSANTRALQLHTIKSGLLFQLTIIHIKFCFLIKLWHFFTFWT